MFKPTVPVPCDTAIYSLAQSKNWEATTKYRNREGGPLQNRSDEN